MVFRCRVGMARKESGAVTAEFGPALFLLLIVLAFPLMDMLALGLTYFLGSTLNSTQVRQASQEHFSEARDNANGAVRHGIPQRWMSSGLGQFCHLAAPPDTTVTYKDGIAGDKVVVVTTTIVANPMLTIPFFVAVPGLSAPATFSYTSEQIVENPENAP
ncbi:MAG TPA: hypothetical protein V6D08_05550 [Candidatus Obscuribacterales bacterium]